MFPLVANRRLQLSLTVLFVGIVTGVGLFFGWVMDHSLLPPGGGGWVCYSQCVLSVWLLLLMFASPVLIVMCLTWLWRWLIAYPLPSSTWWVSDRK